MALHPDITRKDDVALALGMAADALLLASTQQTGNAGSVTIPNADGSKTVMGADAGDTTVARFVGRVTPPNRPTGITAESHMSTLFVAWDGTLEGGMDAAFLFTRITISYADADGDHSVDLGDLRGKGSVGSTTLPVGTVVTVVAHAYDDAHDETGMSTPNVSAPSDPIMVTIVDEAAQLEADVTADIKVVSDKADKAQGDADKANQANTQLRSDVNQQLDTVNNTVAGVKSDAGKAQSAADKAQSGVDAANTKITQTNNRIDGVTTTISNVSKNADDALSLSTQNHQDLTGLTTTVQRDYSTKAETLNQVTAVSQKADAISATLSRDYQKTGDADSKYATKTALQATANSITASVSETYATQDALQALQNIADNAIETWQGHGAPSMSGEPTSDWTTDGLKKQHSGDMYYDLDTGYSYRFGSEDGSTYSWDKISDSDITRAMQAAADAQSDADKANTGVSKLNTDIPATYATKSEVKITTDGIKTDVSKAMTLGQTGIDNAATVDQKADGIQATVTQQAQTITDNVKAIAQVNMRADSLSTSITQVSNKTDLALANAQELVVNGLTNGTLDNWSIQDNTVTVDSNGVIHYAANDMSGWYTIIWQTLPATATWQTNSSRTFRVSVEAKTSDNTKPGSFYMSFWGQHNMEIKVSALSTSTWTTVSQLFIVPPNTVVDDVLRLGIMGTGAQGSADIAIRNISMKDITEAQAAQKAADDAQSTANTAVSQSSTLSQDLSGFKTSVNQTYETKTDSANKATTAQQNLDGFKTSVQQTYVDKTTAGNTYSTKTEVQQTKESLSSQINAVGDTANSAMNKVTSAQQDLDGFKTSVSSTYATKQALSDTDSKASGAASSAALALANAAELVVNGGFESGSANWTGGTENNGIVHDTAHSGSNAWAVHGDGTTFLELDQSLTAPIIPGHTYRFSVWARIDPYAYVVGGNRSSYATKTGLGEIDSEIFLSSQPSHTWFEYVQDWIAPSDAVSFAELRYSFVSSTSTIWLDDVSLKDITEVAQLQSDVAATYASQSSVQQTASQITQQVAATYATKDDVSSKYTSLQQTDSAFDARIGTAQSTAANAQSNAANAQNRAGVLETLIHSDANGVRVGKTVDGSYTGYSALVNSNGSFDVLNPAGQMVSRFNSDGIQMPSGIVTINGLPLGEDITDKLVFMNTYWQYRVSATRILNQVIMQVWCMRHGDPGGDYVPTPWRSSQLFKIKWGYRPYGVPGDTNGQDIHFPMANNAVDGSGVVSPAVYMQVTDTFISIRSPYGNVHFKNDITWLSGVVSWVIDPDHQTNNDDTPTQN